jgi:hypothetical protein
MKRSRDNSVDITTDYEVDDQDSILSKDKVILSSTASRLALDPTQSPMQWVPGDLSPGVKRPGREADHSSPFRVDVKNGGTIPPLPFKSSWHSV